MTDQVVGEGRCPIVDTWWQTETGAIMITPLPGAREFIDMLLPSVSHNHTRVCQGWRRAQTLVAQALGCGHIRCGMMHALPLSSGTRVDDTHGFNVFTHPAKDVGQVVAICEVVMPYTGDRGLLPPRLFYALNPQACGQRSQAPPRCPSLGCSRCC